LAKEVFKSHLLEEGHQ